MTSDQALYAEAILGKDAEEFLRTDLGRYLLERVEEEEKDAMEALANTSPWRRRRIVDLQAKVWRARSFKSWISELIVTGRQALQQLENTEA
jgi:hypothetical protein